jgi:hypothetical protein
MPKVNLDAAMTELRDARNTAKDIARSGDWSRLDTVARDELCNELNAEDEFHGVPGDCDTEMEQDRLDAMAPEGSCYEEDEFRGMDHDPLDDMGPWPQDEDRRAAEDLVESFVGDNTGN